MWPTHGAAYAGGGRWGKVRELRVALRVEGGSPENPFPQRMKYALHAASLASLSLLLSACAATSSVPAPKRAWTKRFRDPVSAATTFESPTIQTNVQPIVINHRFPASSIFGGGDLQVVALQARYQVNDKLALIATKDGYIDFNPAVGAHEEGFADIGGGFKYAAYEDPDAGILITPGFIFETKSGDKEVFQGNGDGVLRPFVTGGIAGLCDGKMNVIGSLAYNHPLDDDEESTLIDWHLHLDYEAAPGFYPLFEINGITYLDDGNALGVDFEGTNLINLGAMNVEGNDFITGALGARYQVSDRWWLGFAFEKPIGSRDDISDDRVTVDAIFVL